MNNEAAFVFSTFKEFYKCWKSGTNARLFIESVNGKAFINFSAYLGYPDDAHSRPRRPKWNPSKPRKKSERKMKRDNDRAARFQQRKKKEKDEEEAAPASALTSASKPAVNTDAIATSSLGAESEITLSSLESSSPSAESVMTISGLEFSFASPVPEVLRNEESINTSMAASLSDIDSGDIKSSQQESHKPSASTSPKFDSFG